MSISMSMSILELKSKTLYSIGIILIHFTLQNLIRNMEQKLYNLEDRLVRFAGEVIYFSRKLNDNYENQYYKNQLIRSSGSSALNYGEAQATITNKDFIYKCSIVIKELKESRTSLKILKYINEGDEKRRHWLLIEIEELIAISSKMIQNKKVKSNSNPKI